MEDSNKTKDDGSILAQDLFAIKFKDSDKHKGLVYLLGCFPGLGLGDGIYIITEDTKGFFDNKDITYKSLKIINQDSKGIKEYFANVK